MISFLLFLQILFAFPFSFAPNHTSNQTNFPAVTATYRDTLYWSPGLKLTWDDFQGEPPPVNGYAAYTYTIITLQYTAIIRGNTVSPEFKIRTAFNRNKSWVHKNRPESTTPVILAHEKGHFDISEITARRLRQALTSTTYRRSDYKEEIDRIYDSIVDEGQALQELYDLETDHSTIDEQQDKWLLRVKNELNALNAYAN